MTQKPGTKLAKMFTPGSRTSPPVTEDGSYFIDACPRAFDLILNWLRKIEVNDFGDLENYDPLEEILIPADVNIERLSLAAKKMGLKLVHQDEDAPFHAFHTCDFL